MTANIWAGNAHKISETTLDPSGQVENAKCRTATMSTTYFYYDSKPQTTTQKNQQSVAEDDSLIFLPVFALNPLKGSLIQPGF